MNKKTEHPFFFKPDKLTKQTIDFITFDPRLITENNLIDDNISYRFEQIIQEQQSLFTTNENYNENDNKKEDYTPENQNENRNGNIVQHINENNTNEYTTPESTTSTQDAAQTGTSTNNQFVRVPTRIVSPRQNTYNPQSDSDTSPRRIISFNFPSNSDDEIQDETQNLTSLRNTSVNVSSPQCSLIGTALDWYTNLHISYKQQWNSFVQFFKKQFCSQKTAYYAQVEAMSLMKKDKGTVRHFALRVQQLVKKGWCNENAATINLKNNEILQKDYLKS